MNNVVHPGDCMDGMKNKPDKYYDMGFDFEGWELDADYWQAQENRFQQHIQQKELFEFVGGEIKI